MKVVDQKWMTMKLYSSKKKKKMKMMKKKMKKKNEKQEPKEKLKSWWKRGFEKVGEEKKEIQKQFV